MSILFFPLQTYFFTASVHLNEDYFEDPLKFKPERYLDEKMESFTGPSNKTFWFGLGKRRCAGEILARAEGSGFKSNTKNANGTVGLANFPFHKN